MRASGEMALPLPPRFAQLRRNRILSGRCHAFEFNPEEMSVGEHPYKHYTMCSTCICLLKTGTVNGRGPCGTCGGTVAVYFDTSSSPRFVSLQRCINCACDTRTLFELPIPRSRDDSSGGYTWLALRRCLWCSMAMFFRPYSPASSI